VLDSIGAFNFCDSAPLDVEAAGAFLRDLNENFFGGLKELRVVCSFSESALIVYSRHFKFMYKRTCGIPDYMIAGHMPEYNWQHP
jgi:hypothetical protein